MYYQQLNGLRFIIVLVVMVQHWSPQWVYNKTHIGGIGVNLFFVLSGFLIGEILIIERNRTSNRTTSVRNFFLRRFLRIFPIYYLSILAYSFFFNDGGILIWNLLYANNLLECIDVTRIPIEFSHLWSLCIEEQFYILFPFVVLYGSKRNLGNVIIALIVISIAFRVGVTYYEIADYNTISSRFTLSATDCLFAGVALAYCKFYSKEVLERIFRKRNLILLICALLLAFHFIIISAQNELLYNTLFRLMSAILGFLLIGYASIVNFNGVTKKILENRVIFELGKISYGLYLFHPFIQKIYYDHVDKLTLRKYFLNLHVPVISNAYLIDFTMLFSLTAIVSVISYYVIEIRFLKLKEKFQTQ